MSTAPGSGRPWAISTAPWPSWEAAYLEEETFELVGPGQENPDKGRILSSSPIGQGLIVVEGNAVPSSITDDLAEPLTAREHEGSAEQLERRQRCSQRRYDVGGRRGDDRLERRATPVR